MIRSHLARERRRGSILFQRYCAAESRIQLAKPGHFCAQTRRAFFVVSEATSAPRQPRFSYCWSHPWRAFSTETDGTTNSKTEEEDDNDIDESANVTSTKTEASISTNEGKDKTTIKKLYRCTPVWELDDYYRRNYNITDAPKHFKYKTHKNRGITLWTATFTCPRTQQTYESGILQSESVLPIHVSGSDQAFEVGSRVYYAKKSASSQAAAARALDSLRYTNEGTVEPRMCEEDPSGDDDTDDDDDDTDGEAEESRKVRGKQKPGKIALVFGELGGFYADMTTRNGRTKFAKDRIECEMHRLDGRTIWTAQFKCPRSERLFQAGTLQSLSVERITKDGSKKVFYNKKFEARQAAAARALDVLRFEKDGTLDPRLCMEDPLDFDREGSTDGKETTAEKSHDEEDEDEEESATSFLLEEPEPVPGASHVKEIESDEQLKDVEVDEEVPWSDENDESDGEELFIYNEPPGQNQKSPAARLLGSFFGDQRGTGHATLTSPGVSPIQPGDSGSEFLSGSALVQSEADRIRNIENKALSWVEIELPKKAATTLHGVYLPAVQSSSTLEITKSLLSSLADANFSCVSAPMTQGVATKLVNHLCHSDNTKPDAEVFNLYLKCLEGNDPVSRGIKAESIVERMKNRALLQGRIPPKPNSGTYNTLLNIWAQVGGANGRYTKLDESFVPDRESFLAILSSSSYADTFDPDFAQQCIQRMEKLYQESGDESLKPDTEIYNAPLRWSGGLLSRKSRPNMRPIPWDDHLEVFATKFKPWSESDPTIQNAERVEKWVKNMVENGISPDIESYESLIQAWVRTGTREGLQKAEAVLLEMPSSVSLRISSFHPILAAWLHAICEKESVPSIRKWLKFLRSQGDGNLKIALESDIRMLCLELASNILEQRFMDSDQNSSVSVELAKQCSDVFNKLAKQIREAPSEANDTLLPLLSGPAVLTITAWSGITPNSRSGYQDVLDSMWDVVDVYENVIREVAARETASFEKEGSGANLSGDLINLVSRSHFVYHCLVNQMVDVAEKFRSSPTFEPKESDIMVPYLLHLERVARRLHEFSCIEGLGAGDSTNAGHLVFADRYDYNFTSLALSADSIKGNYSFPWRMLLLLEQLSYSSGAAIPPDVGRFALLLKEMAPKGRGRGQHHNSKFEAAVDSLLKHILPFDKLKRGESTILDSVSPRTSSLKAKETMELVRQIGRGKHVPRKRLLKR